jgi:hypothetical protein
MIGAQVHQNIDQLKGGDDLGISETTQLFEQFIQGRLPILLSGTHSISKGLARQRYLTQFPLSPTGLMDMSSSLTG